MANTSRITPCIRTVLTWNRSRACSRITATAQPTRARTVPGQSRTFPSARPSHMGLCSTFSSEIQAYSPGFRPLTKMSPAILGLIYKLPGELSLALRPTGCCQNHRLDPLLTPVQHSGQQGVSPEYHRGSQKQPEKRAEWQKPGSILPERPIYLQLSFHTLLKGLQGITIARSSPAHPPSLSALPPSPYPLAWLAGTEGTPAVQPLWDCLTNTKWKGLRTSMKSSLH